MNNGLRFFGWFRILMVACLFVCICALPAGAVSSASKAVVAINPCANKNPGADFSYTIVSSNPPQIVLTDKSTCGEYWRWNVVFKSDSIFQSNERNTVINAPSLGVYQVCLGVGRTCSDCLPPGYQPGGPSDTPHACCQFSGYACQDVTIAAPTTPPSPPPVTTPATQPPQSSPATPAPTAPANQQTQQQSATSAATVQTTAPAPAATMFAPAPAGQGSGAISITTSPPGAEVWIDNEMKGASPAVISALSPGTHDLALRKTGYQNISTTFVIESGQTREYSTGLVPVTKSPGFSALLALGGIFVLFFARRFIR